MENIASNDGADGYSYNNAQAAGSQLYPHGISKYYDFYSEEGVMNYITPWFFALLNTLSASYLILPWEAWVMIFDGKVGEDDFT